MSVASIALPAQAASTTYGTNSKATSETSLAVGENSQSTNEDTTAVGEDSAATAWKSTALGAKTVASSDQTLAVGADSKATGMASTALGSDTVANAKNSTAIGMSASGTKENATAIGTYANVTGKDSTAIGCESVAGNDFTTAIGDAANVTGINGTGVGQDVKVTGADAVAFGSSAQAAGEDSTAMGTLSKALGQSSVAIGYNAVADKEASAAIGAESKAQGENATAIGSNSTATATDTLAMGYSAKATYDSAMALGTSAKAEAQSGLAIGVKASASAENSTAIGTSASATGINSVAIGKNSVASENNAVSVGQVGKTRKIVNLTAGTADTDAVNVSQLKNAITNIDMKLINTTNSAVESSEQSSILGGDDNLIQQSKNSEIIGGYKNVTTPGTEKSVIAGGTDNKLNGHNNTFIGGGSGNTVEDDNTAIIGGTDNLAKEVNSVVAGGQKNTAEGTNSAVAGGFDGLASGTNSFVGGGNNGSASGDNSFTLGGVNTTASGESAGALIGGQATGINSFAVGTGAKASAKNSISLGAGSSASVDNSVAIGSGSVANEANTVSIGAVGNTRKLTNLAAGTADTDAVNVSQLKDGLSTKTDINLSSITDAGKQLVKDLADSVDDTAEVKTGDKNIEVSSQKDGNLTSYTVKLANDITAQTFGVGNNIYISAAGLNANSHQIINVADGTKDTDAVNLGQLKSAVSGNSSSSLAIVYDSDKKDTATLAGTNGTTITNVKAGKIAAGSTDAVNGSQLNDTNIRVAQNEDDIKNLRKDVNQNTTNIARNTSDINDLKSNVVNNTTNISKNTTDISDIKGDVNQNTSDITNLKEADKLNVKYSSDSKSEISLAGENGTKIKNVAAAETDDEAVNLKQLNDAVNSITKGTNQDKNLVRYADDSHRLALLDGNGGTVLSGMAAGKISSDSTDGVNGSQLYDEQAARIDADKKLNEKISDEEQLRKDGDAKLDARIGVLDSGDTFNVIKAGDNVSQNLKALDEAVVKNKSLVQDDGKQITIAQDSSTKVINVAGANGENRAITGVATNPADGSSAANVDYVNNQTKSVKNYADSIGAQAAAMSSLHPLEWDKEDKVSVSASVGSYKSDVAGAIGAFYRPDKKTMLSIQGAFGSNDNMLGIGISKKLGHKDTPEIGEVMSTEDAVNLQNEVKELRAKNNSLEENYQKVNEQNQQILQLLASKGVLSAKEVSSFKAPVASTKANEKASYLDSESGHWYQGNDGVWHNKSIGV